MLGWLLTQAATFGAAEHTHLTTHGLTSHRHDYAAPLAAGAGLVGLLALIMLVVIHLSGLPSRVASPALAASGTTPRSAVRVVRLAPAVAAILFVGVETIEFVGSGASTTGVCGILALGAALQWLVARAACALATALVRFAEDMTALPTQPNWPASLSVTWMSALVDHVVVSHCGRA